MALDTTNLTLGYFGFDEGPDYAGYTEGTLWNGWSQPYFTEPVLRRLIEDMEAYRIEAENMGVVGAVSKLTLNDDMTVTVDDTALYGEEEGVETVTPIETDLGLLWPFGLGWTWQVSTEAPTEYEYVDLEGNLVGVDTQG